jgi:type I restriction enzyme S subunit
MSWERKKIGDLCSITKGKIGITKAIPGEYPLVVTSEERKSHNECHFEGEAVVIPLVSSTGHGHRSLKRIHYQTGKFAVGNILCAVIPNDSNILSAEYLYRFLDLNREKELVSRMRGMANVTLPMQEIANIEIPLPSLVKQKKFVEEYKALETANNTLSIEITNQLDLVKQLRQAFLREAMQGKLVEQNQADETAAELLAKIKAEKEQLIKERKISKQKPLPPISEDEIPFEIPENWVWCRLGVICEKIGSGSTPKGSNYSVSGFPFFRSQNIHNDGLVYNDIKYISDKVQKKMNGTAVYPNDILLNITGGSLGRCALVPNDFRQGNVSQHVSIIRPILLQNSFIHKLILSPIFQEYIFNSTTGAGREGLPKYNLEQFVIPLPPLSEQKRIVAKLDELMAYCDSLEESIKNSQTQNEMLLGQVLREALEPVEKEVVV